MKARNLISEIVILPNPNQLILLRKLQNEICRKAGLYPVLPLCVKCEKLTGLDSKITKIEVKDLQTEENSSQKIISLSVELEINGESASGRIEIGKEPGEKASSSKKWQAEFPLDSEIEESLGPVKKLSPFKIAELETEEFENGRRWKISGEKWGKLRKSQAKQTQDISKTGL